MANKIILVDTSILIDYYRKTDKDNSAWVMLVKDGYRFSISAVTKYELYSGAGENQINYWDRVLEKIPVFPFDENCVTSAIKINSALKRKRKQIDLADLFIAATAMNNGVSIATLNKKHFDRVDGLEIL